MGKPRQVAELGHQRHGSDERHAAQGLQRRDDGRPPPGWRELAKLLSEPVLPALSFVDRVPVFLQRDVLRRLRET
jgi:hypothetical protein